MRVAFLLLLPACSGPALDTATRSTPDLPQVEVPSTNPEWTASDLQAAIEEALRDGFPILDEGQEVYLELFTHGDEDCPGEVDHIAIENLTGCTAESGYYYSGISTYEDTVEEKDDQITRKRRVHGDFLLRDDQGLALQVGGHIRQTRTVWQDTGTVQLKNEIEGSWIWEGDTRWLAESMSGLLGSTLIESESQRSLMLDGALAFYDRHWFFESLEVRSGEGCDWSGSGAVSLRDPSGGWSRLELTEACELCGTAVFEDTEDLGEICLPADLLMANTETWLAEE